MQGPEGSPGSDLMRSWFAGFLRSREIAEIDRAIQGANGGGGNDSGEAADEASTSRPLGPLQVSFIGKRRSNVTRIWPLKIR